ncbi:hypothetical protein Tco_0787553 [Tanacetum coccineum]
MTFITAQQTKLDLELVPKENRFDIRKRNGRIPHGFSPREPTFQLFWMHLHSLHAILHLSSLLIFKIDKKKRFRLTLEVFREILQIFPIVQGRDFDPIPSEEDTMHQPWRTFAALINRSLSGKTTGLDKLRLSRAQIIWGMYFQKNVDYVELLWEDFTYQIDNKEFKKQEKIIGMHTSKDDYLINTLRFVSRKEASQKYGAVLPDCLTSPEMKESKAYKTYLGYATGAVPPMVARKFKKASPSKKDSIPVQADEEPVQKGKRVKRAAKKSSTTPATGIVIREPPVETMSKRKEKEKVDVAHGKGIKLLFEVALFEKAQMKEVRKKSLRDFHKTHPSGSGTVAEDPPSVEKITPTVTSEGTGDKLGVPDVTNDDSTESEYESWGNDEDDNNNDNEPNNEGSEQENDSDEHESDSEQDDEDDQDDDQEKESEDEEMKSDKEQGLDDTIDQFDDDADARLEEPTKTDTGISQGEGTDAEMTEAQQGNENLEKGPVASSSLSSDLAIKFLNFSDIPQTDAEIVSPLDVHVHYEVPRSQAPTLLTIPVFVIPESSPVFSNVPQSSHTFTPTPIQSFDSMTESQHWKKTLLNLRKTLYTLKVTHGKNQGASTRSTASDSAKSNFASLVIETMIRESRDEVNLARMYSQPQSTYEAASSLTEFELKKILIDKMKKSESYLAALKHRDCYDGLKKSYTLDQDFFYSYDVYSLKRSREDKDNSAGSDRGSKKRKTSKDTEPTTCHKEKDSTSGSSKGTKSQPRSSGNTVQSEEPVFKVADSDMPQDQEGNQDDNADEPRK